MRHPPRPWSRCAFAPLVLGLISACRDASTPPLPPAPAAASTPAPAAPLPLPGRAPERAELVGRSFVLREATGEPALAHARARVSFRADELTFHAGCNAHFGPYQLAEGRLLVERIGATEMACQDPSGIHEQVLATFLTHGPRIALDGKLLTLAVDAARLTFLDREEADPDRPLVSTAWKLDSYTGQGSSQACFTEQEPTLRFDQDGSYAVSSSCLKVRGRFKATPHKLTLTNVSAQRTRCADDCAKLIADSVAHVLTSGGVAYEIDASALTLRRSGYRIDAFEEEQ
jgi:heat shock protein HslJ